MGVLGYIAKQKAQFQDYTVAKRKQVLLKKTEKVQADNVRQAELVEAQNKLTQAEIIQKDLREARGPSNVQKFGAGLAKVMNKGQSGIKKLQTGSNFKGLQMGASQGRGALGIDSRTQGMQTGSKDVFSIGSGGQKKEMPKKRPRVIVEL